MPPRHAYWTILIDDQPTAFRAHDPEELLPTLNRLREKNQSAVMRWFERGQLFESREAAREAGLGKGERRWEGPRPDRDQPRERGDGPRDVTQRGREEGERNVGSGARRDKNWRPGGEHRDPRQKYKDAKKDKWNRFKEKIRARHEARSPGESESFTPPHGDKLRSSYEERPRSPRAPRNESDRRDPDQRWSPERPAKPHGDKFRSARPPRAPRAEWNEGPPRSERGEWAKAPTRPPGPKKTYGAKPGGARKPWGAKPGGDARKPWGAKPGGDARRPWGEKPGGARKPWGAKPAGARKPWGAKPAGEREPWRPKPPGRKPGGRPGEFRNDRPPRRRRDDEE